MKRAILIAGPTASGKSAVALALAERYGGAVVNADSMQVYADLAVITARPPPSVTRRVPHHLFGHVDAADAYSVGRWVLEVRDVLARIAEEGQVPIVVGGTGLYLKTLTEGLSEMPAIPADLRARIRQHASTLTPAALHAQLAAVDPDMAERLRPTDPQRVTRALEVLAATGRSLLTFQTRQAAAIVPVQNVAGIFLDVPRADLHARIDARFDEMMRQGAFEEVVKLAGRGLDAALPAMRALGVPQLIVARDDPSELQTAIAGAKQATRQYAKRQVTFARHQLRHLPWVDPADAVSAVEHQLAAIQP